MPVAGGGSLAGGILGGILAGDASKSGAIAAGDAQKQAMQAMFAKLDAVGMPPDQSAKLILDQYKQAGMLTPALEQQVQAQSSAMQSVKGNSTAQATQMQALQRMSQMGQAGLTPDEMAQQRLLQGQVQQANNGNQQSIIQQMAARGQAGGGAEIAARLGASQNAANQGSTAADQVSSLAAQRALSAIGQSGQLAGNIENQTFSEGATKANAQDQMSRFNTQNQMAIAQRNAASQNQAQAANLANAQQISNANVGQTNQEQYAALQRQMQDWQAKLQYAQSYGAPLQAYGNAAANQASQVGNIQSGMISGAFGGLASYMGGQNSPLKSSGSGSTGTSGAGDDGYYGSSSGATGSVGAGMDPNAGLMSFAGA